jgi:hypothetical protein
MSIKMFTFCELQKVTRRELLRQPSTYGCKNSHENRGRERTRELGTKSQIESKDERPVAGAPEDEQRPGDPEGLTQSGSPIGHAA